MEFFFFFFYSKCVLISKLIGFPTLNAPQVDCCWGFEHRLYPSHEKEASQEPPTLMSDWGHLTVFHITKWQLWSVLTHGGRRENNCSRVRMRRGVPLSGCSSLPRLATPRLHTSLFIPHFPLCLPSEEEEEKSTTSRRYVRKCRQRLRRRCQTRFFRLLTSSL